MNLDFKNLDMDKGKIIVIVIGLMLFSGMLMFSVMKNVMPSAIMSTVAICLFSAGFMIELYSTDTPYDPTSDNEPHKMD
jgi:protein-S-isoprenylcysteine O-methyltransferase Ste14